jgi:hypothetical protein
MEEGIFQSIGYKEFGAIPTSDLTSVHPLFASGLERMKLSTRQYAKKQIKWIKKQLLPAIIKARSMGGEVYIYVLPAGRSERGIELLQSERKIALVVDGSGRLSQLSIRLPQTNINAAGKRHGTSGCQNLAGFTVRVSRGLP